MDAKNIFGLVVRTIGLLACGAGLNDLLYIGLYVTGSLNVSVTRPFPMSDLVEGIAFFSIGLYFLRGAPVVLQYAFPATEEPSKVEEDPN
jgi:hypothetical protein